MVSCGGSLVQGRAPELTFKHHFVQRRSQSSSKRESSGQQIGTNLRQTSAETSLPCFEAAPNYIGKGGATAVYLKDVMSPAMWHLMPDLEQIVKEFEVSSKLLVKGKTNVDAAVLANQLRKRFVNHGMQHVCNNWGDAGLHLAYKGNGWLRNTFFCKDILGVSKDTRLNSIRLHILTDDRIASTQKRLLLLGNLASLDAYARGKLSQRWILHVTSWLVKKILRCLEERGYRRVSLQTRRLALTQEGVMSFGFSFYCYQDFQFEALGKITFLHDILAVESLLELLVNNIILPQSDAYVWSELGMLNRYFKVQAASWYMHYESRIGLKINCLKDGLFMYFLARKEDLAVRWGTSVLALYVFPVIRHHISGVQSDLIDAIVKRIKWRWYCGSRQLCEPSICKGCLEVQVETSLPDEDGHLQIYTNKMKKRCEASRAWSIKEIDGLKYIYASKHTRPSSITLHILTDARIASTQKRYVITCLLDLANTMRIALAFIYSLVDEDVTYWRYTKEEWEWSHDSTHVITQLAQRFDGADSSDGVLLNGMTDRKDLFDEGNQWSCNAFCCGDIHLSIKTCERKWHCVVLLRIASFLFGKKTLSSYN
ncbi:hypothetical protein TIFTF001_007401 [Ficus carica]|uniref:Uncharacterized protein n=1 Tax=Ficus carica TaxID=3494 RepID=A0AA87ZR66_FICCA|nr:hypothetical protein TIFTF001_007401 [Ficus carica]